MDKKELMNICEELISNPPCCPELKEAGRSWLDAVGTEREREAAVKLLAELKEDVCTIDDTIGFFSSDFAKEHFGAENVAKMLEGARAAKAAGEVWCTCPACQRGAKLIEAADVLLG
ncbi:MAG: heat-shock protein Hsp90 [Clostridia bacterium]|nr:heat-shock protein Hsp90 [Clostridia bacterium]